MADICDGLISLILIRLNLNKIKDKIERYRRNPSCGRVPLYFRLHRGRDSGSLTHAGCGTGFNPRARRGRDRSFLIGDSGAQLFQSTRPRGARPERKHTGRLRSLVSIHAPAGGATPCCSHLSAQCRSFNPRARGGRDWAQRQCSQRLSVSIHAPAGGATRYTSNKGATLARFNPRARGGRDDDELVAVGQFIVSIHAPAGGATPVG